MEKLESKYKGGIINEEHQNDMMDLMSAIHKYEQKYRPIIVGANICKQTLNWTFDFVHDFSKLSELPSYKE